MEVQLHFTTVAVKIHQGKFRKPGCILVFGVLFGYFLDKQKVTKKKMLLIQYASICSNKNQQIKQHRHKQPMLSDTKSFSFFSQKPCVLSCRFRYETYGHTRHHQIAAAYFLRGPLLPHRHASHTPERACYTRCPPLEKCDHRPLVKRHTTTVTYTTLYVKKSVGLLL